MLRFFLLYLVFQGGLFALEQTRPVQQAIVAPFTESIAALSAWLVTRFDPEVLAEGARLQDPDSGFAVFIEAECNGVEATLGLIAAMLAFPSPWRMKLWGIGIGFLAIQVLNQIRIISLFYLGQWNETLFEWAHVYIWQALIVLAVLMVFLIWMRYLPRPGEEAP